MHQFCKVRNEADYRKPALRLT